MSTGGWRLAAGLVVVGGALALFGPAAWSPTELHAGTDWLDTYGTHWFYWWTQQQVLGADPGPLLFHPWGKDVYGHTGGNILDALLAAPAREILGATLGTNLILLGILLSNAWGGARVAAAAGLGGGAQLLGAGLLLLNPFVLQELQRGRPTQAILVFPCLVVASLLGRPTVRQALLGGVWLALSALTYWYAGMVGAALVGLTVIARWVAGGGRAELLRLGGMAVTTGALVLPFAWPMLVQLDGGAVPGLLALSDTPGALGRLQLETVEGDPQGLFILSLSGVGGALVDRDGLVFDAGVRLLGVAHLIGFGLGVWLCPRGLRAVGVGLTLGAAAIAVGPALILGDDFLANPLYLFGVERLDVLRRWWWPGRAVAWMHLGVVVLAVGGLHRAGDRFGPGLRAVAGGALLVLAAVPPVRSGVAPLDAWRAAVSPGITCLRAAPPGAVIELPYELGQRPLYHQTIHEKPILNGMLVTKDAFLPPELVELRARNTALRLLLDLGERDWRQPRDGWTEEDLEELVGLGYRYVVFRKEGYLRPRPQRDGSTRMESDWPRARRILREVDFLGSPRWEDDELALYTLGGAPLECEAAAPAP